MVLFALPSLLTITMTIEWFACLNDTDGFLLAAPVTETWVGTVHERWNASQYNGVSGLRPRQVQGLELPIVSPFILH